MALELPNIPDIFKQSKKDDEGLGVKRNTRTGVYIIPSTELKLVEGSGILFGTDNNSGENYQSTTENNCVVQGFLHLPQGATITEAVGRFTVASTGSWKLYRVKIAATEVGDDPGNTYMATGDVNEIKKNILDSVIDNSKYKYICEMKMTNSLHAFLEFVVKYNY